MIKKHVFYWLAAAFIVVLGCQKETSFELGNSPAEGSLQSDISGDCLPKSVNGVYEAETALTPLTNNIVVTVNVTKTGVYEITTDTVNGYYFRGVGTFTALGPQAVTLRGNGTPFVDGTDNFVVTFDGSICDIAVDVVPAGTNVPATFTLNGSPGNCAGAVVNGTYVVSTALNSTNTVTINVNVTVVGTYNIIATGGGMTFSKAGTFTTPGANTVTLVGSGTAPATAGAVTVPITVGATSCNFSVPVTAGAVFTLAGSPGNCTTPTIAGTYTVGSALTAANTVTLSVNVTTAGAYAVTLPTVGGITFAASGNFPTTGPTTIQLTGTGTPTTAGNNVFTITIPGPNSCTFTIPVGAGGVAYVADCAGATFNGVYEVGTPMTDCNTIDVDVNVTTPGPYSISVTQNGMTFTSSGTLAAGAQTITLVVTGTPAAAVATNVPMGGTTPCNVTFTPDAAAVIDWKFTVTSPTPGHTYQGQTDLTDNSTAGPSPGSLVFAFLGSNSNGDDDWEIALLDANGTIAVGETYTTATNAIFFYGSGCTAEEYTSDPTTTGFVMTFTITSVVGTTISGTYSGTAKNTAGAAVTITSGTFKGTF